MVALSAKPRRCLHELFEEQARQAPGRTAVVFEGERLSYGELDRRAGVLACALRHAGAGRDARVVIRMERSASLVVGILGILKAGAAYVPVDPAYPEARTRFIIEDAAATVVLTQIDDLVSALPDRGVPSGDRPAPEDLAYVIYTSGSTGRPKGVCVEHRNIVNYTLGIAERLQLEPEMQYAMVSTVAADLGNTVIFPALATGGCLHIVSAERIRDPSLLAEYFEREEIDVLKIAPSHLAALQEGENPQRVMPRKRLVLGGEPTALDRADRLRAMTPGCLIFNHYGPTETTVGVLTYCLEGVLPATRTGTLPLGTPLPNAAVHVLGQDGQPCEEGEQGELFIGGAGVARGYLNRPELTAERFIPDPFSAQAGARLYRSGDLGRRLPDGSIEFCGRIDNQLKIGGYRVEPGEIEHALRSHAAVRDVVALGRDERLVAYVAGDRLDAAALRRHLDDRLPAHMVPQAFVLMQRFPLLPNGKIDRLGLPPPEAPLSTAFVSPRSETEKWLAALWSELLGVEKVGVNDDFFDLGGKSLQAMRLVARVRDGLGVDMQLRNLFERPTLAGLAELVEGLAWARGPVPATDGHPREEVKL